MVLGSSITVLNTFEDATLTGGDQTVFGLSDPTTVVDPGVELPNFIGFYDIDFTDAAFSLTLVDNSGATDLVLPEGRFDRYYIRFDSDLATSVQLDGLEDLNEFASVEILEPGFRLDAVDLFSTGIPVTQTFPNGGVLLEFGGGTDLTNLGVTAQVDLTTVDTATAADGVRVGTKNEELSAVLGDEVTVLNTFQDSVLTGGAQTVFGLSDPETVTLPAVELPNFIDLYDIDIDDDGVTMTLVDNSIVADFVLPDGRFDRYYLKFDDSIVTAASLDGTAELNEFADVQVLAPGFTLNAADIFATGIPVAQEFPNGGLLIELGSGTDLTNLGVSAKINFTAEAVTDDDIFSGGRGNDRLFGGAGNDILQGAGGNDRIDGGSGNDNAEGGRGRDRINGKDGNDSLFGNEGRDRINGGNGSDTIVGGFGKDSLITGKGRDVITYADRKDRGDTIRDFNPNQDTIDLSAIVAGDAFGSSNPFDDYVSITQRGIRTIVKVAFEGDDNPDRFRTLATLNRIDAVDISSQNFTL